MQVLDGVIERSEVNKNAMGGSELMTEALVKKVPKELLEGKQIIVSRLFNELRNDRHRILVCHDLAGDPANDHLDKGGWRKFHRIVFVSYWQRDAFLQRYHIPYSKTCVLHNAIDPIEPQEKSKDVIKFIYHTTPHRGLEILIPVFKKLREKFGEKIKLDVYSSFGVYGWHEKDKEYAALFEMAKATEGVTYFGAVSNDEVRNALSTAHIFAYPSIWPETFCISMIEAMSAGMAVIHPNFAALPEIAANWTCMYNMHEEKNYHAGHIYKMAENIVENWHGEEFQTQLMAQRSYVNNFYGWELRRLQWIALLQSVQDEDMKLDKGPVFTYNS